MSVLIFRYWGLQLCWWDGTNVLAWNSRGLNYTFFKGLMRPSYYHCSSTITASQRSWLFIVLMLYLISCPMYGALERLFSMIYFTLILAWGHSRLEALRPLRPLSPDKKSSQSSFTGELSFWAQKDSHSFFHLFCYDRKYHINYLFLKVPPDLFSFIYLHL